MIQKHIILKIKNVKLYAKLKKKITRFFEMIVFVEN